MAAGSPARRSRTAARGWTTSRRGSGPTAAGARRWSLPAAPLGGRTRRGHAVKTSWALLSLVGCGRRDSEAVRRGVAWLRASTRARTAAGRTSRIAGVFNRTCAIHYDIYLRLFPLWALAVCGAKPRPG